MKKCRRMANRESDSYVLVDLGLGPREAPRGWAKLFPDDETDAWKDGFWEFTDVELTCAGHVFRAHKCVLA